MAAWLLALVLLVLLVGGCATGSGRPSGPGFQEKHESEGMGGGSM
jgi:hypothetical protein